MRRRLLPLLLLLAPLRAQAPAGPAAWTGAWAGTWTAAWTAAPDSPGPAFHRLTLRQTFRVSVGGPGLRLRFSNRFGTQPLTLGPARVAAAEAAAPGLPLTFAGRATVTLPPGAEAWSDAAPLAVAAGQRLAVTCFVPGPTGPSTQHGVGLDATLLAEGDATAAQPFPATETSSSRYFLMGAEVAGATRPAFVAFGDSLTDGVGTTPGADARWSDRLAARLQARPGQPEVAVVNAGIAGNRLLRDGAEGFVGPSALARFDRDALSVRGVRWVLLLEGINDLAATTTLPAEAQHASAAQLIEGMKALVARAHARGVQAWGATLPPFGGMEWPFHSAAGEAARQALNAWIRGGGAFDRVVDLDRVLRDPAKPDRLRPDFDSGDHLHPNDAGHRAMAEALDLRGFGDR